MNWNKIAKKTLEWLAVGSAGFYVGVYHVAEMAYRGRILTDGVFKQPDWVTQVQGYELPIIGVVIVTTALWIGVDYYEYKLTKD